MLGVAETKTVSAGMVSKARTLAASLGPGLVIVTVYMSVLPIVTWSTEPSTATFRLETGETVATELAEASAGLGFSWSALALAVSRISPTAVPVGATTMVKVANAPVTRSPIAALDDSPGLGGERTLARCRGHKACVGGESVRECNVRRCRRAIVRDRHGVGQVLPDEAPGRGSE